MTIKSIWLSLKWGKNGANITFTKKAEHEVRGATVLESQTES